MEPHSKKPQKDASTRILELEKKIKELEEQLKKLTDVAGRAQADLQNAKARMVKDDEDRRKFASEMVLMRLLPTIDNFQRAFQHLPEDLKNHEWVKGIFSVEQDLMKQLFALGLKRMESLEKPVDPNVHEVLMTGPGEEGKVIEVFEEGYELNGKVLRPAKVKAGISTTNSVDRIAEESKVSSAPDEQLQ